MSFLFGSSLNPVGPNVMSHDSFLPRWVEEGQRRWDESQNVSVSPVEVCQSLCFPSWISWDTAKYWLPAWLLASLIHSVPQSSLIVTGALQSPFQLISVNSRLLLVWEGIYNTNNNNNNCYYCCCHLLSFLFFFFLWYFCFYLHILGLFWYMFFSIFVILFSACICSLAINSKVPTPHSLVLLHFCAAQSKDGKIK